MGFAELSNAAIAPFSVPNSGLSIGGGSALSGSMVSLLMTAISLLAVSVF